jgi:hypothetical protein
MKRLQEEKAKKKFVCKCKKSKCLKLYCECFANGEFCIDCNCVDCSNTLDNEDEKEEAFRIIKDKNPVALKLNPIAPVKEKEKEKEREKEENSYSQNDIMDSNSNSELGNATKIGCNCTKSNCSKKYCECFKANAKCTEVCRCRECCNNDDCCGGKKKNESTVDVDMYSYEDFVVEKISVFINKGDISIICKTVKNIRDLLIEYPSKREKDFNHHAQNPNTKVFKHSNSSIIIEIEKKILHPLDTYNTYNIVSTPNKFINKKRNLSTKKSSTHNTIESNSKLKLSKTACESEKKISKKNITKMIGKKLIL